MLWRGNPVSLRGWPGKAGEGVVASFSVKLYSKAGKEKMKLIGYRVGSRMGKWSIPLEVSFRTFVAITFAGTISFHILGLALHTYIGREKSEIVGRIESLAEVESQVSGVDAGLYSLHELVLRSSEDERKVRKGRKIILEAHLVTILLERMGPLEDRTHFFLPRGWAAIERGGLACLLRAPSSDPACLDKLLRQVGVFQEAMSQARMDVNKRLLLVESRQIRLERWDTWLYWATTILGLLFMAMGWRNVVLQVGEPIKDVAGYLESFDESAKKKSSPLLPPLFSISELAILVRNMSQIYRDPLTGVLIRRAILKILEREISRAESGGGSLAVAIFDVDLFKRFNDCHGHLVGDVVLRHVAQRMEEALGEGEFLGRWGGEEFMVVSPGLQESLCLPHFDRIRELVSTPLRLDSGEDVVVTVSGGMAFFAPGMSEDGIFKLADRALYRAKESGRNRVIQADPAIDGTTNLREES